jgi:large subunit ribosomal protein L22
VKEAFVNGGTMMKRVLPAPMGRAFRVRKRSNHITIVVAQRAETKKTAPKAKTADTKKAAAKIETTNAVTES